MAKKNAPPVLRPAKLLTEEYDMLSPILESVFNEIKELSKKKQDAALNKLKVSMTNRVLVKIQTIMNGDPAAEFLELLDEAKLPTNSDAVLILAHFKGAMQQFHTKHYGWTGTKHEWITCD